MSLYQIIRIHAVYWHLSNTKHWKTLEFWNKEWKEFKDDRTEIGTASGYRIGERIYKCKSQIDLFCIYNWKDPFWSQNISLRWTSIPRDLRSKSFQFEDPHHIQELQYVTLDPLFVCGWCCFSFSHSIIYILHWNLRGPTYSKYIYNSRCPYVYVWDIAIVRHS